MVREGTGLQRRGLVPARRSMCRLLFQGRVAELNFGGVDYEARVWVNGVYVGRHYRRLFVISRSNITSALHKGADNLVVVRVDCPVDPGYEGEKTLIKGNSMDDIIMPYGQEGSMGGIYRSVSLRARGDVGISEPVGFVSTQRRPEACRRAGEIESGKLRRVPARWRCAPL